MRTDDKLKETKNDPVWASDPVTGRADGEVDRYKLPRERQGRMSLSGHERNHLFLNQRGSTFVDGSGISGLDSPADSRSFVIWDYDRDGRLDLVVANTNAPALEWYRNEIPTENNVIAIRLLGGNYSAQSSGEFSNRDGVGAKIIVALPELNVRRELRCGEGLAAQNSSNLLIGIGDAPVASSVTISWPSGKQQQIADVPAGSQLDVYENTDASPDGSGFSQYAYVTGHKELYANRVPQPRPSLQLVEEPEAELVVYTSMATWCAACIQHTPHLQYLREKFTSSQVQFVGVAVDEKDTAEKLDRFMEKYRPPYALERSRTAADAFTEYLATTSSSNALPASIVVDRTGGVLEVFPGAPTVSDLERLLHMHRRDR